ncbi:hypothetical protein MMG85_11815 [Pseudoxanthomonas sp. LH2527]|uniref:hypothetical protein n=1 Tax=Pseudoxanthomonas sp. LH2527 TaxID=2923249 RepID=UPI001F14297C|nr:hypothetical protein [Pseudoxanthomonas sp. LH2527]
MSPREMLLTRIAECLQRIRVADGYLTDAGLTVTREPAPVIGEAEAAFIAVVWDKQDRAVDPARSNTSRLTTVQVLAKVPATLANAQAKLDALTTDIEEAMADQAFRYPVGFQFPQYQSAQPLAPQQVGQAWIGVAITYTSHIPIRRRAA